LTEFSDLPKSWLEVSALDACLIVVDCHNKTAPYKASGIKLIRTSNIRNGQIDLTNVKYIDEPTYEYWSKRCKPEPGDIIFTREAPMGEVGIIPPDEKICMGQRMMLLRADNKYLLNNFLFYSLQAEHISKYIEITAVGTGVKHLRVKDVESLPIRLAPINEQRRIVSTIEQLTDRSNKARAALEDVPKLIEQFRQSVLAAAFQGDLTADWREKNLGKEKIVQSVEVKEYYYHKVTAAGAWEKCLFQDICIVIGGSQPSKNHFVYEPEEGYIRLIQIRDYKSDKFTTFIPKELARRFCNKSDIMIGRYGPPIFQILRGLEGAYNVALMKAEPNLEKVDKEFLFYYLQTPHLFNYVEAASQRTAGQDGVKKELLNTYTVFVPSLDEQLLIVKKVKEAFKAIDIIENQHLQLFQEIPGLDRSILAKAFRGELVPQDPNDEPAAVLLERIRAEREQTSTPKQRGKTTRKNSSKQLSIEGIE
jgi:type I restriction enzyme, S subunit